MNRDFKMKIFFESVNARSRTCERAVLSIEAHHTPQEKYERILFLKWYLMLLMSMCVFTYASLMCVIVNFFNDGNDYYKCNHASRAQVRCNPKELFVFVRAFPIYFPNCKHYLRLQWRVI